MITIAFDITTSLWLAILPSGYPLAFRTDADGNPIPDRFSTAQRALREARLALRDSTWRIPHMVDSSGISADILAPLAAK